MRSFKYVITDEAGIHARPAGMLAKQARETMSEVIVSGNGKSADAAKLMSVMGLGIKKGMEVEVTIEGEDEEQAAEQLEKFFRENL